MEKLFEGCDIETSADYLENREHYDSLGETVVYTGTIDAFYGYRFGKLEYRSLRFESQVLDRENHQGVAVVNYTDRDTPYTRVIEHKHFEFGTQPKTVITREYPVSWQEGMEPYYPVNDQKTRSCTRGMRNWPGRNPMYCLAAAWENISTTTWTR